MNTINIDTESRPLGDWLPQEGSDDVIYLTRDGLPRFVVVPLDAGDQEVLAVRKNARLMEYLAGCVERARTGPTKSLAEIRAALLSDENAP